MNEINAQEEINAEIAEGCHDGFLGQPVSVILKDGKRVMQGAEPTKPQAKADNPKPVKAAPAAITNQE